MEILNSTDTIMATDKKVEELKKNVDAIYLLTNATFVCLMQCGFACLEAGSIRSKNVTNIMMKNILDVYVSCLAFWLIGYAIAYGEGNSVIGLTFWAGMNIPKTKFAHWFFQFVFAATAATLVSGAVAERCNFVAYLIYSALISGFIYPMAAHWVWYEYGWLNTMGYSDFAGCGPVHLLGGVCSAVAAVFLGPRIGRFDGKDMPGHSIPLIGIGGMLLITGFLSFNGGSLGTMTTIGAGSKISLVTANTIMCGTGGAASGLLASKTGLTGQKSWSFCVTLNSALTGMVSVCAAADSLSFWSSFVLGIAGGFVYVGFHRLILFCKIDDPLDAISVHLGGGIWGILAGPLFKIKGPFYTEFLNNIIGALAIIFWSLLTSIVMFGLLKYFNIFRVDKEDELIGLDISKHKEPAYPNAGWSDSVESSYNLRNVETKGINVLSSGHDYINKAFQLNQRL